MSAFRRIQYVMLMIGTLSAVAVLVLGGCGSSKVVSLPGTGISITLASGNEVDSQLNAEMYALLLAAKGYNATIERQYLPSCGCPGENWTPALLEAAIASDRIQIYPAFTGSAIAAYDLPATTNPVQAYNEASAYYEQTFQLTMLAPAYGLDDTNGFCTTQAKAAQFGLTTISSLVPQAPHLVLGAFGLDPTSSNYPPVERAYGPHFKKVVNPDLAHPFNLASIEGGQVDIIECYTTDPQLAQSTAALLQDDKNAFGVFNPVLIVRDDLLSRSPAIRDILNPLAGHLTTAKIDALIAEVANGQAIQDVAQAFLKSEGLLH